MPFTVWNFSLILHSPILQKGRGRDSDSGLGLSASLSFSWVFLFQRKSHHRPQCWTTAPPQPLSFSGTLISRNRGNKMLLEAPSQRQINQDKCNYPQQQQLFFFFPA